MAGVPFEALADGFNAFEGVCIVVRCLLVFFKGCKKDAECGERFDVFICIDVSDFSVTSKPSTSERDLDVLRYGSKFHVLFYPECARCGDGLRISPIVLCPMWYHIASALPNSYSMRYTL